ncbi:MAG: 50S ribosomal protein L1 [Phototrophicales bacterium]|nr:MAG: 50S ribosomal protein L1 [Phototrophicales bacterium]RMG73700.1 MAG: 50S ribosomal protein L1 [Chloroflexota bacterium]
MPGKRYLELSKKFDRQVYYNLKEAVDLAKSMATAKFDETIEIHFRLGIDPRHSDQQVRSTVMLPHGTGKTVRVLVFAEGEDARAAEAAGADIVGGDELLDRIAKDNFLDFDAALATPPMMKKIGRVARILGPRGLMPNPKAGTVVQADDLERAVQELKAGRVEFRNDKTGNLHIPIGKASFDNDKLLENAQAVVNAVNAVKPSGVKGVYIRRVVLTPTMGPGVRVDLTSLN